MKNTLKWPRLLILPHSQLAFVLLGKRIFQDLRWTPAQHTFSSMTNASGAFGKWVGRNFPRSNKWENYFLRLKKMNKLCSKKKTIMSIPRFSVHQYECQHLTFKCIECCTKTCFAKIFFHLVIIYHFYGDSLSVLIIARRKKGN